MNTPSKLNVNAKKLNVNVNVIVIIVLLINKHVMNWKWKKNSLLKIVIKLIINLNIPKFHKIWKITNLYILHSDIEKKHLIISKIIFKNIILFWKWVRYNLSRIKNLEFSIKII